MQEMNSLTLNGTTYDCFVDDVARPLSEASAVVCSASGENIVVSDSSNHNLVGLHIYGKSTQDGTPTPDAPVDIESVGDGDIGVTLNGINLFNLTSGRRVGSTEAPEFIDNGFVLKADVVANRIYTFRCTLKKGLTYFVSLDETKVSGTGGVSVYLPKLTQYIDINRPFVPTADTDELGLYVGEKQVPTVLKITNVQVSLTSTKKAYEAFSSQAITLGVNELRGVPITDKSVATYADASGQMWCADEIEIASNAHIQRIGVINRYAGETVATPYLSTTGELTEGATVLYVLETPIETPLASPYKALHTNKPSTTVINDSGAYMTLEYVADAKSYIDNKVASAILTATLE